MKHYSLKNSPISFNGAAIKKLLPNIMEFPKIDILLRESIQNSFDALKDDAPYLRFQLRYGSFRTRDLSAQLDDMQKVIDEKHPQINSEFIEVRDFNTKGLGGSTIFSENLEDWGDFIRLVFAVANEQTGVGKGGSWGYGKTNYYSLGEGIVVYYTQTFFEEKYEQRLIIALVEDTRKHNRMIYPDAKLGISYWGSSCIGDNNVLPCTDPEEIKSFLNIFGLKPFGDGETGTSIIIPFVNCENLYLSSVKMMMGDSKIPAYSEQMFQFIINVAVQRWYFPRLMNESRGQYLRFECNDNLLTRDSMYQLFQEFQEIYNDTFDNPSYIRLDQEALRSKETKVATYSFRKLKLDSIINPYGMTIYQMLGVNDNKRPNAAIGFRCRSLGMINRYDIDKDFVDNTEDYDPGQCLVVGMRPIPDVLLYDPQDYQKELTNMEEYIRKGEDPTHSIWADSLASQFDGKDSPYKLQVIQQMMGKLKRVFEKKESRLEKQQKRNLAISRTIGKLLLPSTGFGTGASGGSGGGNRGGSGGGSGGGRSTNEPISYGSPIRINEGNKIKILFPFEINQDNTDFTVHLTPCVEDIKSIAEWEKKCGVPFPIAIESFRIQSIDGNPISGNISLRDDGSMDIDSVNIKTHHHNNRVIALSINHPVGIKKIDLELTFDVDVCKFKTNIEVNEGGYLE